MLQLPDLWNKVAPYTMVGRERISSLMGLACAIDCKGIPGDVVECGCCNGGSGAAMAHIATHSSANRVVWLLDSFKGMPLTTAADGKLAVEYVGEVVGYSRNVEEVLRLVGSDLERVKIVPGWFNDSLPLLKVKQIALLNIDCDWYESVKLCLEMLFDRVVPGGYVSIDDYGHWPGCKKAVDEFFAARGMHPSLVEVDYTARWFQKV